MVVPTTQMAGKYPPARKTVFVALQLPSVVLNAGAVSSGLRVLSP